MRLKDNSSFMKYEDEHTSFYKYLMGFLDDLSFQCPQN